MLGLIEGLLTRENVEVEVVVTAAGPLGEELRKRGVRCWVVPFEYNTHPMRAPESADTSKAKSEHVRAIVEIVAKTRPDVIYSNSSVIYYGAWAARIVRKPHVWHLREYGDLDYGLAPDFGRDYFRSLLRESAAVVSISRSIERHHLSGLDAVNRSMIYNGVAESARCATVPRQIGKHAPLRLAVVGVVQPMKGHLQAIDALSLVRRQFSAVSLAIVGTGPADYVASLHARVRELGLDGVVSFVGYVADPLLWMRDHADVVIMASENEAFGRVTAEAMTQAIPVIGRNSGGTPEIITHDQDGLLYDGTSDDLARKILMLAGDPAAYARLSEAALRSACDRFTTERYVEEVHGVLKRVVQRPAAAPASASSSASLPRPTSTRPDPFLRPTFDPAHCDLYWVRSSILQALRQFLPLIRGSFLDVGCGIMPYRDMILKDAPFITRYIGLDIETDIYKAPVDLRWDGKRIPLADASVDCAMATEVLEHCPEPLVVLKEIRRVLRPGGVFFFTVPYIWPLHDAPHDFFRYTPFALEKLLMDAGFEHAQVKALGGWNASLAQMIGLWLKRAPMPDEVRGRMTQQLWPLYSELIKTDELPSDPRAGNTMSTGWSGVAFAPQAEAPAREVQPNAEDVMLVRCHEFKYSETFIEDHVDHLSDKLTLIYGYPFPRYEKSGLPIVTPALEKQLRTVNGRLATRYPDSVVAEYVDQVAAFLEARRPSVVLLETGVVAAFFYKACLKAGVPYVVHFHGVDATGREILSRWGDEYRKFFRNAAAVVAVSQAMRSQLISLGAPPERLVLSPYGVSVAMGQLARPQACPPVFLAVGRFVEKKGPQKTLEAFARVHRQEPSSKLIMVGDGPLLRGCRQWVLENGLEGSVTFAGVQSRAAVSRLMANSRVFVQHSLTASDGDTEGLPLAVLEAGAHGLPVVATRHAGIPDAVENGTHGFLVEEGDVAGMAECMARLAVDATLAVQMGSAFRERVVSQFSRHASITRLQQILARAAQSESEEIVDVSSSVG